MNDDTQPDQHASGLGWMVARFGTLVVAVCGSHDQDEQFATEAAAEQEFSHLVAGMGEQH